jgi:hypothetical protein
MRYNRRVHALKVTCDLGSKSRPDTVLVAVVDHRDRGIHARAGAISQSLA